MNETLAPNVVAEYELETWSRCANNYLDTFAGITQETVSLLMEAGEVCSGNMVLDIGSGPGNTAGEFAKFGANVTGVDFSSQMVEIAQKRYPDITFEQADAEELPFADCVFENAIANFVVHHLARPEKVFAEVQRVLKPGGRFAFAVWGPAEEQSSFGVFFGAVEAHCDAADLPHGPLFGITDREVYEPMFAKAGMEIGEFMVHETKWKTDSLEPVLQGFWEWGNMSLLPSETQAKIEATTREGAQPFRQDGRFVFPHSALVSSGTKL